MRTTLLLWLASCGAPIPCGIVAPEDDTWVEAGEVSLVARGDPGLSWTLQLTGQPPRPVQPHADGHLALSQDLPPGEQLAELRGTRGDQLRCRARARLHVAEAIEVHLDEPHVDVVHPRELRVSGSAAPHADLAVRVDGQPAATTEADPQGRFTLPLRLEPGLRLIEVAARQRPQGFLRVLRRSVLVGDGPPARLALQPANPTVETALQARLTDAPPDGASLRWAWSVDGAPAPELTTPSVPASRLRRGQTWTVQLAVDGPNGPGPTATASTTILNSPPAVRSVRTTDPRSQIATLCSWEFSDPDGDPDQSTVRWTIDGVLAGTEALLSARPLQAGRELRCEVTPSDGISSGPPLAASAAVRQPTPGNVLVILLDDVGAYDLTVYDPSSTFHTPALDQLAAEGLTFQRAWSTPFCAPTRAAALTGLYPLRTGFGANIRADEAGGSLASEAWSWAEQLRATSRLDWSLAAVGKWHIASAVDGGGVHVLDQGFDQYRGAIGNLYDSQTVDGLAADYYTWEKYYDDLLVRESGYLTIDEAEDALELMRTLPAPWMVWFAPHAAHEPFHEPPVEALPWGPTEVDATGEREKYAHMIESVDQQISNLLQAVPPDTHVIVLADNGVPGSVAGPQIEHDRHKGTVFEGGVRIPLLVRSPLIPTPGARTDALVHVVDLFPTLVELGGGHTAGLDIDGRSFASVLSEPTSPGLHEVIYTERFEPNGPGPYTRYDRAIRDDTHKLVLLQDGIYRLFRLDDELLEGTDLLTRTLSPADQAAFDRLRTRLETGDLD